MLSSIKIGSDDIKKIVSKAKEGHYQIACQEHFDITHPDFATFVPHVTDAAANHPNAWYQHSVTYHRNKANGGPPSTSSNMTAAVASSQGNSTVTPIKRPRVEDGNSYQTPTNSNKAVSSTAADTAGLSQVEAEEDYSDAMMMEMTQQQEDKYAEEEELMNDM